MRPHPPAIPFPNSSIDALAESTPEQAVAVLFDQLRDRLLRYLLTFGLPVSDCEELIQETFLALFRHLLAGKPRANLHAWVFRVAHNQALKRRASQARTGSITDAGERMRDAAPGPEETAVENQRQRQLAAVMNALPERDRRCLALRAEGLRYREIAEVLGMSLGAVTLSLSRSASKAARALRIIR